MELIYPYVRGDGMVTTRWVCAQVWSKTDCFSMGSWTTANFRRGAAATANNVEMNFLVSFLCWRFSERLGFGGERSVAFWIKQE